MIGFEVEVGGGAPVVGGGAPVVGGGATGGGGDGATGGGGVQHPPILAASPFKTIVARTTQDPE